MIVSQLSFALVEYDYQIMVSIWEFQCLTVCQAVLEKLEIWG